MVASLVHKMEKRLAGHLVGLLAEMMVDYLAALLRKQMDAKWALWMVALKVDTMVVLTAVSRELMMVGMKVPLLVNVKVFLMVEKKVVLLVVQTARYLDED